MSATGGQNLDLPVFDEDKHWPEWADMLGQSYEPGDVVAYAATVGRSAGLSVAMVRKINRVNSKGEPNRMRNPRYSWSESRENPSYDVPEWLPSATITLVPLKDSSNRYGRCDARDVTVGDEKIIKLHMDISEVLNG